MLDPAEAQAVAAQFGVAAEQVRRDHLLTHLLAALARDCSNQVVFFGGTALARTHLPEGRLSEDIDLIAVGSRRAVVGDVERALAQGVRREYGPLTWDPPLSSTRATQPGTLLSADGLAVRVQLLDPANYPPWPTEIRELVRRYSDAPPTRLRVLTLPAFVAAKTTAWADRQAPRDLFDLWALAHIGAITAEAGRLFAELGPTSAPPATWLFQQPPSQADWVLQLAGQTALEVSAADALAIVRAAWEGVGSIDGKV